MFKRARSLQTRSTTSIMSHAQSKVRRISRYINMVLSSESEDMISHFRRLERHKLSLRDKDVV